MKAYDFPFEIKVDYKGRPATQLAAPVTLSDDEAQQLQELVHRNGGERDASRLRLLQALPILYRKIERAVVQACEARHLDKTVINKLSPFGFSFSIPDEVLSAQTATPLSTYYDELFLEDLKCYFLFEKKDGLLFMKETGRIPAAAVAAQRSPRTNEEEMFFIALISFIFAADENLLRLMNSRTDEQVLARMINDFGLPWISTIHEYELEGFIAATKLDAKIRSLHDAEALRDAGRQVEPFMLNKLLPFIRTWDNCSLYRANHAVDFIGGYVGDSISELFRRYYHRYYRYQGLLGTKEPDVIITDEAISSYYPKRFFQNFQSYFTCSEQENGYKKVWTSNSKNKRWEDGNPGGNASDNLMFSCILLYMFTAQQSILRKAGEETEALFHQYAGWPMMFAGEGDQYVNPLVLIEEAGLHPTKQESGRYHDAARTVFSFFRREFDALLDGFHPATRHEPFAQQFLTAIQEGEPSAKSKIRDYLDQEEERLLSLILKWGSFPADHFCLLLSEEGIQTNDYSN